MVTLAAAVVLVLTVLIPQKREGTRTEILKPDLCRHQEEWTKLFGSLWIKNRQANAPNAQAQANSRARATNRNESGEELALTVAWPVLAVHTHTHTQSYDAQAMVMID